MSDYMTVAWKMKSVIVLIAHEIRAHALLINSLLTCNLNKRFNV